jgi:hypothetical protein
MRTLILLALVGCGGGGVLDELPSPERCEVIYEVTATGDVNATYEVGYLAGGTFTPLVDGSRVELSALTIGIGQWGYPIDVRVSTQDPITFPERVCAEIREAPNHEGGSIEQRGNVFDRQADGSLLAKNVLMAVQYKPRPGMPFSGVIADNGVVSATVEITYPGYGFSGNVTKTVTFVNDVGYLGTNAHAPDQPDAGVVIPPASYSSCTARSTTPPQCTDFEVQPITGAPPPNLLDAYTPTFCDAVGAPLVSPSACEGGLDGIPLRAQCTIRTNESWGILTIKRVYYGPPQDPAAAEADCVARGGFWSSL